MTIRVTAARWQMSQATLRLMLVPGLVFIVACLDRQFQTDFWMHLARGCEIVATGDWISADHFTIAAAGAKVVDPNWLTQVFYARLFAWGGLSLIQSLNGGLLALTLVVLIGACRPEGAGSKATGLAALLFFLLSWQTFLIRPQTLSVLLFALLYALLRRGNTRIALVAPLILLLWANVHGAFAIGLVLIGIFVLDTLLAVYVAGRGTPARSETSARALPLCLALVIAAGATLLNPYGAAIYRYALELPARVTPRHLEEWLPPRLDQSIGLALLGSILLLVLLHVWRRRWPKRRDLLLMVVFGLLACHAVRMIVWWAVVITPIVADLLTLGPEEASTPGFLPAIVGAALIGFCGLCLPVFERSNPLFGSVRSSHRLEADLDQIVREADLAGLRGGIYTQMEWAQYLTWRLGPQQRLLVDSHVELFDDASWQEYRVITSGGAAWAQILSRRGIDYLLLDDTYQPALFRQVQRSSDWNTRIRRGHAILFARRTRAQSHDASTFDASAERGQQISSESGQNRSSGRYRPNAEMARPARAAHLEQGEPRFFWRKPSILWTMTHFWVGACGQ